MLNGLPVVKAVSLYSLLFRAIACVARRFTKKFNWRALFNVLKLSDLARFASSMRWASGQNDRQKRG